MKHTLEGRVKIGDILRNENYPYNIEIIGKYKDVLWYISNDGSFSNWTIGEIEQAGWYIDKPEESVEEIETIIGVPMTQCADIKLYEKMSEVIGQLNHLTREVEELKKKV